MTTATKERFYLIRRVASFQLGADIIQVANDKKAQVLSADGLAMESMTGKDTDDMSTRQDIEFIIKIHVDSDEDITSAENIADQIMEEAQEQFDDPEDDEDDEEEDDEDLDDEE